MSSYPVILSHLEHMRCLVIGGGQVAFRKVKGLLAAHTHPVVISPELCPDLADLRDEITHIHRVYQHSDLEGVSLVIVATDDADLNRIIAAKCRRRGILVNVVDCPELCTFTAPAVVRRGDLLLAIATGGRSPAFARYLRQTLETIIDPSYGELLDILGELRPQIHERIDPSRQREAWDQLLDGRLLHCLQSEGYESAVHLASQIVSKYMNKSPDNYS